MTPLEAAKAELARRQGVEAAKAELARRQDAQQSVGGVEGGRIVSEGGTYVFRSPGYATDNPEHVAFLRDGGTVAEIIQSGTDQMTIGQNPVAARLSKLVEGVPFAGQYADEAVGKVFGQDTQQAMRQSQDAMDREMPGQATTLQVLGGIAGAAPLVAAAAPAALAPATITGRAIAAGSVGAVGGGAEGVVSGYGRGRTPEQRVQYAAQDGITGAALGAGLGAALPALGSMGQAAMARFRKLSDSDIASALGVSKESARIVKRYLTDENLEAAQRRLDILGDDAMLADAGPVTGQLLDTTASTGGGALRVAREAADGRAAALAPRLGQTIDAVLGDADGIRSASRQIAQRTAEKRQAAYDRAFNTPIDYSTKRGAAIEDALAVIPDDTIRRAIQEANDAMLEAGRSNQQILAKVADDGSAIFETPLNVEQVHHIKQALQSIAEDGRDATTGRVNASAARAGRLATRLRDALTKAVPEYAAASRLGGDKIAEDLALRTGLDLFKPSTTFETVRDSLSGASVEAKAAARRGVREHIENTIDNVKRSISSPNIDIQQQMRVLREMSSNGARKKLRVILSPAEANRLIDELDRQTTALELRAAIALNSKTAIRQSGQEALDEAVAPGVLGELGQINPVGAAQRAGQALTGQLPGQTAARRAKFAEEIASVLTGIKGPQARAALEYVQAAADGQELTKRQIALISRATGESVANIGYQLGTQYAEQ